MMRALPAALFLLSLAAMPLETASPVRAAGASPDHGPDHGPGHAPDHGAWAALLDRYVTPGADGINRVDYGALSENAADREALGAYIAALAETEVSALGRDRQFALWVNLYNALTVQVVTDHTPVKSIRDISISPGLFSRGPWGRKLVTVEGREMSLDDIEHETLRKRWDEPRVHYAVNCASIGCPNLRTEPFTADALDAQLEDAARAYVGHPRGVRFEGEVLHLSSIYDWYGKDFGATRAARLDAIARHADAATATRLRGHDGPIRYHYDWSLNDIAGDMP